MTSSFTVIWLLFWSSYTLTEMPLTADIVLYLRVKLVSFFVCSSVLTVGFHFRCKNMIINLGLNCLYTLKDSKILLRWTFNFFSLDMRIKCLHHSPKRPFLREGLCPPSALSTWKCWALTHVSRHMINKACEVHAGVHKHTTWSHAFQHCAVALMVSIDQSPIDGKRGCASVRKHACIYVMHRIFVLC